MSEKSPTFRRMAVETSAIVFSILLALALDAAWQDREEGRQAQELLVSLRAEFEFHRSELIRHGERWTSIRGATGTLLRIAESDSLPHVEVVDSLFWLFIFPPSFDPRQGTLTSATTSGQLRLIADPQLQRLLAGWGGVVDELQDNEISGRDFMFTVVVPYLAREGVPLARALALAPTRQLVGGGARREWPAALPGDESAFEAYQAVLFDPEFAALASWRLWGINDAEYRDAVEFVDELLGLIDARIR